MNESTAAEGWANPMRFPPLGNPWALGIASGQLLTGAEADQLGRGAAGSHEESFDWMARWSAALQQANAEFFRLQVDGFLEPSEPRSLAWDVGDDGYSVGLGLTPDRSVRKLVALLVLTVEPEGIEVEILPTGRRVPVHVGAFLVFPAYLSVRLVGPEGVITCLVGHGIGPALR